jgi:polyphosphate kinase
MTTTKSLAPATVPYLDRDLSWLEFNRRVLHEALDERTPLLERVKFLAIFSSNLDEWFMKRVERLKCGQAEDGAPRVNGAAADQHLARVRQAILPLLAEQARAFTEVIRPKLAQHGVRLLSWTDLDEGQRRAAVDYFRHNVFPLLTPLKVDPAHPFPFISNLSTSLGVFQRPPRSQETRFARVKIPAGLPQWVALPASADGQPGQCFVKLLDIIASNLEDLFPGMHTLEVMPFRVTRNADVELDEDEEGDTLTELVEEGLRRRRLEAPVRLEYGPSVSQAMLTFLAGKLKLSERDLYHMPAEVDYSGLWAIAGLNRPGLRDPPWQPVVPLALADEDESIFTTIRQGDLLVHHPYESFDASVARFIRSAAEDPRVQALKMTVYRIGSDTPFIDALVRAAEAGKEVACLVEVTARFDEMQNLRWAQTLDKVGVHVVYGVVGLKTHSKAALVVRKEEDGLRCYAHVGTGNYHVKTARLYTDLGLMTCDPALTRDVVNLFHFLTGGARDRKYQKLLVAPVTMRQRFLELIEREVEHRKAGRPARLIAKMNQLEDSPMCEALVSASRAGLSIDLVIRGFCVLPPGVPGLTETVRVISVIGRFLEHSRIYYFQNGAESPVDGEFFIGSADWMRRNLSGRVEAIAPVQARPLRERLWGVLDVMLRDHRQAWDMQPDGSYVQRTPVAGGSGPETVGTQQALMDLTLRRQAEGFPG